MKTVEEVEKYADWCQSENVIPRFKGYFPFEVLLSQGRIAPMHTSIRMMESSLVDILYYVDENGLFEQFGKGNIKLKPKEVLVSEKYIDGWEPENMLPKAEKVLITGPTVIFQPNNFSMALKAFGHIPDWQIFSSREKVRQMINSLSEATQEELRKCDLMRRQAWQKSRDILLD